MANDARGTFLGLSNPDRDPVFLVWDAVLEDGVILGGTGSGSAFDPDATPDSDS